MEREKGDEKIRRKLKDNKLTTAKKVLTLISTSVQLTIQETMTPYNPPHTPARPYLTGVGSPMVGFEVYE